MILCWAAFRAILGCIWPAGPRLDTPGSFENTGLGWGMKVGGKE